MLPRISGTGAWVAQSVKCPTLDFCSVHDLMIRGFEPCIGLQADSTKPVWDSLSPLSLSLSLSLSAPLLLVLSLSLSKINELKKKNLRGIS